MAFVFSACREFASLGHLSSDSLLALMAFPHVSLCKGTDIWAFTAVHGPRLTAACLVLAASPWSNGTKVRSG